MHKTMGKLPVVLAGLLGCLSLSVCAASNETSSELLSCLFQEHSLECAKKASDAAIDRIETEVMGKTNNSLTFSKVIEQSGSLLVDAFGGDEDPEDEPETDKGMREGRKKKFGKKKFKLLKKVIPIFMLFQAKLSLILRLISTHFQLKFFAIAVISLIVNVARFWLDLKRAHAPEKVVYYEHAQHQHHYEHDEEPGYWRRRSLDAPLAQDQAYSAWSPE